MKERKHEAPPRYDAAFKEGAIRLVTEEGRPMREMAEELGVCTDTIRNWLKASGIQPKETERQNRLERRQRDLEAENRALRKQLAQKDEVIEILKKPSAYFPDHRGQIQIHPVCICGSLCGSAMPTSGNLPQRLLRLASSGHQPQKTAGSATVSSTYYPASATASLRAGHPVSHDPEENGLLQKADLPADAAAAHPVRTQIRIQAHHKLQAFPPCCTESFEPEFSGF